MAGKLTGRRIVRRVARGAFFGESRFFLRLDATKAAFVALVERMKERGMTLLDVQFTTSHLMRFGAKEVPREEYLKLLKKALAMSVEFFPKREDRFLLSL